MVKKVIVCVSAAFFAIAFLACSSKPDPKEEKLHLISLDNDWTQITKGEPFPWKEMDGFFQSDSHPYGFDRHPKPKLGSREDSVVYVSVLKGDSGKVALKINQDYGSALSQLYDYYICEPAYPYNAISSIDTSEYVFAPKDSVETIALCRTSEGRAEKVQELHMHSYSWKEYDFYVYIMGNEKAINDRDQMANSNEFWDFFDKAYGQAIVKHGNTYGEFVSAGAVKIKNSPDAAEESVNRHYILSRANGKYDPKDSCMLGDILEINEKIISRTAGGGTKRNLIQVAYPAKRFWPLTFDGNNNIQICGEPTDSPVGRVLELEPIADPKCPATAKASVTRDINRGIWRLRYKNGREEDATTSNVDAKCMVFADTALSDKIGESPGAAAITWTWSPKASVVFLPWNGNLTAKLALHELGHTMGLDDLKEDSLSVQIEYLYGFPISNIDSEEDNLMHENLDSKAYKLRKRGIFPKDTTKPGKEYQWDCFHNKGPEFCAMPTRDPDFLEQFYNDYEHRELYFR